MLLYIGMDEEQRRVIVDAMSPKEFVVGEVSGVHVHA